MGKMAGRKVAKLVTRAAAQGQAIGFVEGLEAAAQCKSIAEVRKTAGEGRAKLDAARAPKEASA